MSGYAYNSLFKLNFNFRGQKKFIQVKVIIELKRNFWNQKRENKKKFQ